LTLVQDAAGTGLSMAAGRGALMPGSNADYWSFSGTAGNLLSIVTETPGNPGGTGLSYDIYNPTGASGASFHSDYNGHAVSAPTALPSTGTYTVRVSPYYGYFGEYHFRALLATPPLQEDTEPSNTIANAAALTLAASGNSKTANVAGTILVPGDLNYYNLGT